MFGPDIATLDRFAFARDDGDRAAHSLAMMAEGALSASSRGANATKRSRTSH